MEGYDENPAISTNEDEDHRKFWHSLAYDLDEHAKSMDVHSRKAKRIAEVVRTVSATQKFTGKNVPNNIHYVQTVTRKSDAPFKKT